MIESKGKNAAETNPQLRQQMCYGWTSSVASAVCRVTLYFPVECVVIHCSQSVTVRGPRTPGSNDPRLCAIRLVVVVVSRSSLVRASEVDGRMCQLFAILDYVSQPHHFSVSLLSATRFIELEGCTTCCIGKVIGTLGEGEL